MVGIVGDVGVVDTLEKRLADAGRHHADGEYGETLPLEVVELGIRAKWAMEHPSRPTSPRPVNNKDSVDVGVNAGDQVGSSAGGTSRRTRSPSTLCSSAVTWKEAIEPQLEMAGLMCFDDGTVETLPKSNAKLHAEFCAMQLLTFMVTDDLYIGQLEEQMTHLRMGEQETVTDYCNQARRLMACIWMADVEHSTASYVTHVIKGLLSSYNLMKRLSVVSCTKESLNEDSLTSYIGQHGKPGGGGSGGGRPAKDADKGKSAKDSSRGGGSRRRECWLCGDPDHLSVECLDRDDSDYDDAKGGRGRSAGHRPRRESKPRKEKKSTKSTSAKDTDSFSGGKGRGYGEASCSLVGVVESTVSLAPVVGEDFQVVAADVQANPAVVLLDSSCSHHLMGTKDAFVDLGPSGNVQHVRGFNGALQTVQGRGTVALQGEAGKQVLIPDVLYVPGVHANLLKETDVQLQDQDGGSADHCHCNKVDAGQVVREACPCQHRHHHKLGEARGRHWPRRQADDRQQLSACLVHWREAGAAHRPVRTVLGGCQGWQPVLLAADGPEDPLRMDEADKSDVLREFEKWLVVVERETKKSVLMLRSDWEGEFHGRQFTDFMDSKGIVHDLTCPYTPQQNGMAEWEMRTVVESVMTMLLHIEVDTASGDNAAPTADGQEARLDAGLNVGLHGAVPRPRAAGGHHVGRGVPRDDLAGGVEIGARAGIGADAGQPADGHIDDDSASTSQGDLRELTSSSASGDEGSSGASPVALAKNIADGRRDIKQNAFVQSKLDKVLYMYQPDYNDDGTGRVCKLLKSLYGLKQSSLLWYKALDDVLAGADRKKSKVDQALYFKVGDDGVTCWVLVYVDDLLVASSSTAMLRELKELLEAAFELMVKYLGLEIVHDRPARKLWLHQQSYADKLRRRFIYEEHSGRVLKTPVSVNAYTELTFDNEDAQEREEEEYRQKVGRSEEN
ncbi:unnamed protein product [Closterium sp. NIES-54]